MGFKPSIPIKFGERFRSLRRKNGFTQDDMAEILELSSRAVSSWETGERLPSVEMVAWLAENWGVSVDYLLGRTDYPVFEIRNINGDVLFSGSGGRQRETHEELGMIAARMGLAQITDYPDKKDRKEPELSDEEKRKLRQMLAKLEQDEASGKNATAG